VSSGKDRVPGRPRPLALRILREPTVQFALVAGLLFVVAWASGSGGRTVLEVDGNEVRWRVLQAELAQGGPLSTEERQQVEDTYVDQQVLAREARAMGLEQDERIDDLLAQKMLHVLSGDVIQPGDGELQAYYDENTARYAPEPTVAVDEIVVPDDASDSTALPEEVRAGGSLDDLVGDVLVSHRVMPSLTRDDLAQLFSAEIAARVMAAAPGEWIGPHATMRGRHWLRVNGRTDDEPLPFESVRERVRLDWIADQEAVRLADRVAELRNRYEIRIVDGEGAP
jgi:PPIC-type PPIASE domain